MSSKFSRAYWWFVCLPWRNIYSDNWPIFKTELLFYYFNISLCILDTTPLSDIWFANIFCHSVSYLFTSLMVSFEEQNILLLMFDLFFLLPSMLLVPYLRVLCQIQGLEDLSHIFRMKKSNNDKCWQRHGEIGILRYC